MDAGLRAYMLRVYNYMLVGLGLTGAVAWLTANTPLAHVFYNQVQTAGGVMVQPNILGWIAMFAPLGMVLFLSFRIQKMSFAAAQTTFWAYAALMGISLSTILFVYTGAQHRDDLLRHRRDLRRHEPVGLHHPARSDRHRLVPVHGPDRHDPRVAGPTCSSIPAMLQFVISVIGVLIFTGLTAYDSQSIKNMYIVGDDGDADGQEGDHGRAAPLSRLHQPVPVPAAVHGQPEVS